MKDIGFQTHGKGSAEAARHDIALEIWDQKYRLVLGPEKEQDIFATWRRVASALAVVESPDRRRAIRNEFETVLFKEQFFPGGRIIAGAGAQRTVTLFNCFVMGTLEDDLGGIFDAVRAAAKTMQAGGGIGQDFSTLRPRGARVHSIGGEASGPVSFMDVWDAMCQTIMSAGKRRGAMMATLACDHPDIEEFITAKRKPGRLSNFNLSVLVTDAFMDAVSRDTDWDLRFEGHIYRSVRARDLWSRIMQSNFAFAEPGVIFIDRVNSLNNLAYCEHISATNPCGEQPLPPHGACLLGSICLDRFVLNPFGPRAQFDFVALDGVIVTAVRMLDNAIDASEFPLHAQRQEAIEKRRIGLGVTGLADALAMLGHAYGGADAVLFARKMFARLRDGAYAASIALAREKGAFPKFERTNFLNRPMVQSLPVHLQQEIAADGIRNGLITSIAPTGTISLLAGNVSSGIEPIFSLVQSRRVVSSDGRTRTVTLENSAHAKFRTQSRPNTRLPISFVTVADLTPSDHLNMVAAAQPYIDSAISKTINCREDIAFEDFAAIYSEAYVRGLKGCTTYRPNKVTGSILSDAARSDGASGAFEDTFAPNHDTAAIASTSSNETAMHRSVREREAVLTGHTYKLKWPPSDHALYVTINDVVVDGARQPFEIFINSKNLEHYAWTLALTRMISAIFRRGGDISFVVEELEGIFDPRGGNWLDGHYVPSLLAAIGTIVKKHLLTIGYSTNETQLNRKTSEHDHALTGNRAPNSRHDCPKCGNHSSLHSEGCLTCNVCGFSNCT